MNSVTCDARFLKDTYMCSINDGHIATSYSASPCRDYACLISILGEKRFGRSIVMVLLWIGVSIARKELYDSRNIFTT